MYRSFFKRFFDLLASLILIIILIPLWLILLVLFSISNKGPVFFTQLRSGFKGSSFRLIKFRTMNNRRDINKILLPDNERITKTGRFLRSISADELPQLINVLKGDMSLVGPRPLLPDYLSLYNTFQARRHDVRPGITGWAQVNGRNTVEWEEKFAMDVWYTENLSFRLDLKILFMTGKKVLKREGINAGKEVTMTRFTGTREKHSNESVL